MRQGIHLSELDPISEEAVRERIALRERKRNIPSELVRIRMKHYQEKIKEKITLIK
jgi:hypothetical protein